MHALRLLVGSIRARLRWMREMESGMIGNNELRLNQATMIEAVQEYLDSLMINHAPKVSSVVASKDSPYGAGETFVIAVTDKESTP